MATISRAMIVRMTLIQAHVYRLLFNYMYIRSYVYEHEWINLLFVFSAMEHE